MITAFPILCTFLYLDYEHVLYMYSIKLVTQTKQKIEFPESGLRRPSCNYVLPFISNGSIVWKLMCETRASNLPSPHYHHLFINSAHSPDNLFIYLFIRDRVLVAYTILLSSLVERTELWNEHLHENTNNRDFRPGLTKTRLYSHRSMTRG